MCPAHLPPPRGIPRRGAPAIRHQDAADARPQEVLCHGGPPRQADGEDGHPGRDGDPQPGTGTPCAPAGLIQVRHGLHADRGLGCGHGGRDGCDGRLLQRGNRPQTQGGPKQVGHDLLGRALRPMIRPRAQGHGRLQARPKAPRRHPQREVGARACSARRAHETVQLILRHDGLHRRQFGHLMPLGLAILAVQGLVAAGTVRGLYWPHHLHVLQRHQRPGLALVPWLPPGLAATGRTTLPWSARRGRITRRRRRGVLGVHAQALEEAWDGGLQRCNTCFECTDIGLRCGWRTFPYVLWQWRRGLHGFLSYATHPTLARVTGWNHVNGY
jgi:hypothetical protein